MQKNDYAGSRILLVEDEESLAIGLDYNLSDEGYVVTIAPDGKQALDYIDSKNQFDLVLLAMQLILYRGEEVRIAVSQIFAEKAVQVISV